MRNIIITIARSPAHRRALQRAHAGRPALGEGCGWCQSQADALRVLRRPLGGGAQSAGRAECNFAQQMSGGGTGAR